MSVSSYYKNVAGTFYCRCFQTAGTKQAETACFAPAAVRNQEENVIIIFFMPAITDMIPKAVLHYLS